ncbi:MAG: hypothetical protein QOD65_1475, partial [Gaiellales bacterium]|nr:hypothetical protein [Gaiellales bacterium]
MAGLCGGATGGRIWTGMACSFFGFATEAGSGRGSGGAAGCAAGGAGGSAARAGALPGAGRLATDDVVPDRVPRVATAPAVGRGGPARRWRTTGGARRGDALRAPAVLLAPAEVMVTAERSAASTER